MISRHQIWEECEQFARVMYSFDGARLIVVDGLDTGL
jgi:hypothetical protein